MSAPGIEEFGFGSLLLVWPLIPGVWASHRLLRGNHSLVLWLVALASLAALVRSWPYRVPRHSPYADDAGPAPYQDALDASRGTATLTFWAHPETSADFQHPRYPVTYQSEKYSQLIHQTQGATGFAALFEGYRETGSVGGAWDRALDDYTRNQQSHPLWAVGELDLHEVGESGGKFLGQVETILLVEERSRRAVLDALRKGSMYAVLQPGPTRLTLEHFRAVCGEEEKADIVPMGQQAMVTSPCHLEARFLTQGEPLSDLTTTLVRDGVIADERTIDVTEGGIELRWEADIRPDRTSYFRLIVRRGNRLALFSNPVFLDAGGRS